MTSAQVKCDRCPTYIPAPDPYFASALRGLLVQAGQKDIPDLSAALCDDCYRQWQVELDERVQAERIAERQAMAEFRERLEEYNGDWSLSWGLVPEPYFKLDQFRGRCRDTWRRWREAQGKGKRKGGW